MAKNSVDAYGAEGKTNLLTFDPENLVIVTDPNHPLYDERHTLVPSEEMILNVMYQGVIQPIVVTKNVESGETEVVAGRQRVKAAREANRRLREQGRPTILVPGTVRRGQSAELADIMVSENEVRKDDTPINRAQKMSRLQNMGRTDEQLATIFGCSVATVTSTLALLDCTAAVRNAVDAGKINVNHAKKLAKLSPDEQRSKVSELIAAGEGKAGHEKARATRAVLGGGPRLRGKKEIQEMASRVSGPAAEVLAWVMGAEETPFLS